MEQWEKASNFITFYCSSQRLQLDRAWRFCDQACPVVEGDQSGIDPCRRSMANWLPSSRRSVNKTGDLAGIGQIALKGSSAVLAKAADPLHKARRPQASDSPMCFSATASFAASGVIGVIGLATLRHVREPRTLLFAATPMLFSLHQLSEGLVWLGLEGRIGRVGLDHVVFLFMLYAQGILPLLMPVAVLLMEPPGRRRIGILLLTGLGAVACLSDVYGIIVFPSQCFVEQNSIAYRNPITGIFWISILYILATCGALLLSSHRVVRIYGLLNVIGLTIVHIVKGYAFASVWCFYAATLSIILYWQFNRGSIVVDTPNRASPVLRPILLLWLRRDRRAAAKPS
jgi:hypothetical protein